MSLAHLIILYALIITQALVFAYFAAWYHQVLRQHREHIAWVSEEASSAGVVDLPGTVGEDLRKLRAEQVALRDEFEKHVVMYTNWRREITKMKKNGALEPEREPVPTNNRDVVAELRRQIGLSRLNAAAPAPSNSTTKE